jgi:DNA-binding MarR family transcriptional regulator
MTIQDNLFTSAIRNEAFKAKLYNGLGNDEQKVFEAIKQLGKANIHEIMDYTGLDKSAVSARRRGLYDKGLVRPCGKVVGREGAKVSVFEVADV